MKQKLFCLLLIILLFVLSCGSETTESTEEKEVLVVEETVEEPLWVNDEPETDIAEQAEKFAETVVYYMNKEDCNALYKYISDDHKKQVDEQTFLNVCRYWVYYSSFMVIKFEQIDDETFIAYVATVYTTDFDTMMVYYNDEGFSYEYFNRILEFRDVKTFCSDYLVWDDSETCIEQFALSNEDETFCTYLGSETKVEYCKEKVRRLMD